MNDLEYATFETVVKVTHHFQREWRYGQAVMNVLSYMRPDMYNLVRETELNCFHRDDLAPALMNWLRTGVPAVPERRPWI